MGLASTFDLAVAVDPADSSNVAVADADWGVLTSTDDFASVDDLVSPPPLASVSSTSLGIAWDASVSPSALILSGGARTTDSMGRSGTRQGGRVWRLDLSRPGPPG